MRNEPGPGLHRCPDDADDLADNLMHIALSQAPHQHPHVNAHLRAHVLDRGCLISPAREGRQSGTLTLTALISEPLDWDAQRARFAAFA